MCYNRCCKSVSAGETVKTSADRQICLTSGRFQRVRIIYRIKGVTFIEMSILRQYLCRRNAVLSKLQAAASYLK